MCAHAMVLMCRSEDFGEVGLTSHLVEAVSKAGCILVVAAALWYAPG